MEVARYAPGPSHALPVALYLALFLLITLLRLAVSNPIEAVGFLYVIPISLLAAERGWRGGLFGAAAAFGLTIFWAGIQDVPLGVIGYLPRAVTFTSIGLLVGLHAEQRRKLQDERERLIRELHATAMRDQLTGLPNRRAWDERFEHELRRAGRSGQPLSIAAIDLDKLKQVNDAGGHEQGDRLIRRCAHVWMSALRETDFIARFGGDEFLVLLPDCPIADAEQITRRMLDAAPSAFSIGIATWDGQEAGYELVHRSDQAMYAAKAAGGGRTALAPTPPAHELSLAASQHHGPAASLVRPSANA